MRIENPRLPSCLELAALLLPLTCLFHQGFITMAQFRGIIAEVEIIFMMMLITHLCAFCEAHAYSYYLSHFKVDPNLSEEDLDGIIAEIDEDGSGTMDFDEFCEMMMTSPEDQES